MTKLTNRLKASEQPKDPLGELPLVVSADCSNEHYKRCKEKAIRPTEKTTLLILRSLSNVH